MNASDAMENGQSIADLLTDIACLSDGDDEDLITQRAKYLAMVVREARQRRRFADADLAVQHSYALLAKHDTPSVALHIADALLFENHAENLGRALYLERRQRMADLAERFPDTFELAEKWASLCRDTVHDLLERDRDDSWSAALRDDLAMLRDVRLRFPDNLPIASASSSTHQDAAFVLLKMISQPIRPFALSSLELFWELANELVATCQRWPDRVDFIRSAITGAWLGANATCVYLRSADGVMDWLGKAANAARGKSDGAYVLRRLAAAVQDVVRTGSRTNLPKVRESCAKDAWLSVLLEMPLKPE
jgi:hypothetical protein